MAIHKRRPDTPSDDELEEDELRSSSDGSSARNKVKSGKKPSAKMTTNTAKNGKSSGSGAAAPPKRRYYEPEYDEEPNAASSSLKKKKENEQSSSARDAKRRRTEPEPEPDSDGGTSDSSVQRILNNRSGQKLAKPVTEAVKSTEAAHSETTSKERNKRTTSKKQAQSDSTGSEDDEPKARPEETTKSRASASEAARGKKAGRPAAPVPSAPASAVAVDSGSSSDEEDAKESAVPLRDPPRRESDARKRPVRTASATSLEKKKDTPRVPASGRRLTTEVAASSEGSSDSDSSSDSEDGNLPRTKSRGSTSPTKPSSVRRQPARRPSTLVSSPAIAKPTKASLAYDVSKPSPVNARGSSRRQSARSEPTEIIVESAKKKATEPPVVSAPASTQPSKYQPSRFRKKANLSTVPPERRPSGTASAILAEASQNRPQVDSEQSEAGDSSAVQEAGAKRKKAKKTGGSVALETYLPAYPPSDSPQEDVVFSDSLEEPSDDDEGGRGKTSTARGRGVKRQGVRSAKQSDAEEEDYQPNKKEKAASSSSRRKSRADTQKKSSAGAREADDPQRASAEESFSPRKRSARKSNVREMHLDSARVAESEDEVDEVVAEASSRKNTHTIRVAADVENSSSDPELKPARKKGKSASSSSAQVDPIPKSAQRAQPEKVFRATEAALVTSTASSHRASTERRPRHKHRSASIVVVEVPLRKPTRGPSARAAPSTATKHDDNDDMEFDLPPPLPDLRRDTSKPPPSSIGFHRTAVASSHRTASPMTHQGPASESEEDEPESQADVVVAASPRSPQAKRLMQALEPAAKAKGRASAVSSSSASEDERPPAPNASAKTGKSARKTQSSATLASRARSRSLSSSSSSSDEDDHKVTSASLARQASPARSQTQNAAKPKQRAAASTGRSSDSDSGPEVMPSTSAASARRVSAALRAEAAKRSPARSQSGSPARSLAKARAAGRKQSDSSSSDTDTDDDEGEQEHKASLRRSDASEQRLSREANASVSSDAAVVDDAGQTTGIVHSSSISHTVERDDSVDRLEEAVEQVVVEETTMVGVLEEEEDAPASPAANEDDLSENMREVDTLDPASDGILDTIRDAVASASEFVGAVQGNDRTEAVDEAAVNNAEPDGEDTAMTLQVHSIPIVDMEEGDQQTTLAEARNGPGEPPANDVEFVPETMQAADDAEPDTPGAERLRSPVVGTENYTTEDAAAETEIEALEEAVPTRAELLSPLQDDYPVAGNEEVSMSEPEDIPVPQRQDPDTDDEYRDQTSEQEASGSGARQRKKRQRGRRGQRRGRSRSRSHSRENDIPVPTSTGSGAEEEMMEEDEDFSLPPAFDPSQRTKSGRQAEKDAGRSPRRRAARELQGLGPLSSGDDQASASKTRLRTQGVKKTSTSTAYEIAQRAERHPRAVSPDKPTPARYRNVAATRLPMRRPRQSLADTFSEDDDEDTVQVAKSSTIRNPDGTLKVQADASMAQEQAGEDAGHAGTSTGRSRDPEQEDDDTDTQMYVDDFDNLPSGFEGDTNEQRGLASADQAKSRKKKSAALATTPGRSASKMRLGHEQSGNDDDDDDDDTPFVVPSRSPARPSDAHAGSSLTADATARGAFASPQARPIVSRAFGRGQNGAKIRRPSTGASGGNNDTRSTSRRSAENVADQSSASFSSPGLSSQAGPEDTSQAKRRRRKSRVSLILTDYVVVEPDHAPSDDVEVVVLEEHEEFEMEIERYEMVSTDGDGDDGTGDDSGLEMRKTAREAAETVDDSAGEDTGDLTLEEAVKATQMPIPTSSRAAPGIPARKPMAGSASGRPTGEKAPHLASELDSDVDAEGDDEEIPEPPFDRTKLVQWIDLLCDPDDPSVIGPDGADTLFSDQLSYAMDGPHPLLLAYFTRSPAIDRYPKKDLLDFLAEEHIDDPTKLRDYLHDQATRTFAINTHTRFVNVDDEPTQVKTLRVPPQFPTFYQYCFEIIKDPSTGQCTMETAMPVWAVALAAYFPTGNDFLDYVTDTCSRRQPVDSKLWHDLLDFSQKVTLPASIAEGRGLVGYSDSDEDDWHPLIKQYAAWVKEGKPALPERDDTDTEVEMDDDADGDGEAEVDAVADAEAEADDGTHAVNHANGVTREDEEHGGSEVVKNGVAAQVSQDDEEMDVDAPGETVQATQNRSRNSHDAAQNETSSGGDEVEDLTMRVEDSNDDDTGNHRQDNTEKDPSRKTDPIDPAAVSMAENGQATSQAASGTDTTAAQSVPSTEDSEAVVAQVPPGPNQDAATTHVTTAVETSTVVARETSEASEARVEDEQITIEETVIISGPAESTTPPQTTSRGINAEAAVQPAQETATVSTDSAEAA